MANERSLSAAEWFSNVAASKARRDLRLLQLGLAAGYRDAQDQYGMTALSLSVVADWLEAVEVLLQAGADTELRFHRTADTALHFAVQNRNDLMVGALLGCGANPDAANYWGLTARKKASLGGGPTPFDSIPVGPTILPDPRIQNAEHLAEHYYPDFETPERAEREALQPGTAVDLYIYGPKVPDKEDRVKVRITARLGSGAETRYTAAVETQIERTHLAPVTTQVEFGPEHVATVYLRRPDPS